MEPERPEDVVDAPRRTRLASERTYLAWWRSALAAFAVSLGEDPVHRGLLLLEDDRLVI